MEEPEKSSKKMVFIEQTEEEFVFGIGDLSITIPKNNHLQAKAVLLTFVQNNIITKTEAAEVLKFSLAHIGYLCDDLKNRDIHSLIDRRKGQPTLELGL